MVIDVGSILIGVLGIYALAGFVIFVLLPLGLWAITRQARRMRRKEEYLIENQPVMTSQGYGEPHPETRL